MSIRNSKTLMTGIYIAILVWGLSIVFSGIKVGVVNNAFVLVWTVLLIFFNLIALLNLHKIIKYSFNIRLTQSLFLISFGLLLWNIGNVVWLYYNYALDIDVPFPSYADIVFLSSYPLMLFGIIDLIKGDRKQCNFTKVFKTRFISWIVVYSCMLLLLFFVRGNSVLLKFTLNLIYVGFDVVFLSLLLKPFIIAILCKSRVESTLTTYPYLLLFLGFLLEFVGDVCYFIMTMNNIYYNGCIVDLVYASFIFFLNLGLFSFAQNLYPPLMNEGSNYGPNFLVQLPYSRQISLNCIRRSLFLDFIGLAAFQILIILLLFKPFPL